MLAAAVLLMASACATDDVVLTVDDQELTRHDIADVLGTNVIGEDGRDLQCVVVSTLEGKTMTERELVVGADERKLATDVLEAAAQPPAPTACDLDSLARLIILAYDDGDLELPDPSSEGVGLVVLEALNGPLAQVAGAHSATLADAQAANIEVDPVLGFVWDANSGLVPA